MITTFPTRACIVTWCTRTESIAGSCHVHISTGLFFSSPVLDLLATPLLHLSLSLACLRLGHTCSILEAASHARVSAPGSIGTVGGDDSPQKPSIVAHDGSQNDAAIGPVNNIPHVLGQALGIEILARSLHGAIGSEGGARETLKVKLDDELRGREEQVKKQRLAGQRGSEDEGSEQPPEAMDN